MATTTDRQGAGPARPRIAPPRLHATVAGTLATFLLALAVLAWQMASGRDPVLGRGFEAKAAPPREVVVRRVVVTRVQQADVVEVRRVRHARRATQSASLPPPRPVVRTVSAPEPEPAPDADPEGQARAGTPVGPGTRRTRPSDQPPVMTTDLSFPCMGSQFRLLTDDADSAQSGRAALERFDHRLSRFRPDSELCALNADPRAAVPASPLMRGFVRAALWAAERTGGLIDPTLLGQIEAAGYRHTWSHATDVSLADALAAAPARHPARPAPGGRWRELRVDGECVVRPPGLTLDSGGCGKGLAADAVAVLLQARGQERFAIDCGGDLHVHAGDGTPWEIGIEHPVTGDVVHTVRVTGGGVASSGLGARIWRTEDGRYAHHLLDPATGEPVWSGLIGATALGASTLEAETLAKAALLSGPHVARRLLRDRGGLLVHDDGDVELVGPVRARPRVRVTAYGLEEVAA